MDYFTNTTPEQRKIIAQYNLYQLNEPTLKADATDEEIKQIIQEHCGDSHINVLAENASKLVYLSVDSGIEVIMVIDKMNFEDSIALEMSEVLSAIKA